MNKKILVPVLFSIAMLFSGCATHSTSKDWNGLMGPDGHPSYYKVTSKVALKLFVFVPFMGDVSIDGMIDDLTASIAEEHADHIRIVQADSENYWYGFPPFTWIITPVINTVAAQYSPSDEVYKKDQSQIHSEAAGWHKYTPMGL